MNRFLLTTALLGASTLGASAQDLFRGEAAPDEIRASDLIGMRVYASEAAVEADEIDGPQEGWEDIGEINDLVLARDGSVQAALVDVGGFLGVGERQVAVTMSAMRFVSDSASAEDAADYFLVINASRANLEEAPDYAGTGNAAVEASQATAAEVEDVSADLAASGVGTDPSATDVEMTVEGEGTAAGVAAAAGTAVAAGTAAATGAATEAATETEMEADETVAAAEGDAAGGDATATTDTAVATETATDGTTTTTVTTDATTADAGATARTPVSREGYIAVGADQTTAEALQGAAVYDAADERVGEVGELLIDDAGQITDVVLDVGGFLGIGERTVALPMTSLDVLQQEGGEDLRVYVSQTREELEGLEAYAAD